MKFNPNKQIIICQVKSLVEFVSDNFEGLEMRQTHAAVLAPTAKKKSGFFG